ncbi:MAG: type II secretion system protein [Nitrospirae bacterium]|nr:type II secretion system protein [Nitrospirota bacterium]
MKMLKNEKGFTLIELVLIIVILGILGAVATVQFGNIIRDSKDSSVVGGAASASAQLAIGINAAKTLPTATAGTGNCNTGTGGDNSFNDRVYSCLSFTGGVFKGGLENPTTTNNFNICTGAACAGATGTGCGSITERFVRVTYTSTTGALAVTSPTGCAS